MEANEDVLATKLRKFLSRWVHPDDFRSAKIDLMAIVELASKEGMEIMAQAHRDARDKLHTTTRYYTNPIRRAAKGCLNGDVSE